MQALAQILIALAAASLFAFATVRNIVASGIAGVASLVFYDIAMCQIKGGLGAYLAYLPIYVMFYAAYLVLSVSFTRFSPKVEESPRLPGVVIGMFSMLLLVCVFYGMTYLAALPSKLNLLYAYAVAFFSSMLLVVFLIRDVAKIGLALLSCVWYCHAVVPETNVLYMSTICVMSMFVVGAAVYYAYREYNSRNIDLMVKLRL